MISAMSEVAGDDATLTVDELSARVGMTVRTLRFYAGRGLIPPPIRRAEAKNAFRFCARKHAISWCPHAGKK